ncbi:hypothetical protein BGZ76_006936 [Entomortierella beljakovae]|nr:hypothetical protein BGZ76_006936 [Entomortierella beljakovae]
MELSAIPTRPCSEQVCTTLVQASIKLQPSALHRTSIAPNLWQRVLSAWRNQRGLVSNDQTNVDTMTEDFVKEVLFPASSTLPNPQTQQQRIPIPAQPSQLSQPSIQITPPQQQQQTTTQSQSQPYTQISHQQINFNSPSITPSLTQPSAPPSNHNLYQQVHTNGQGSTGPHSSSSYNGSNSTTQQPSSNVTSSSSLQPETFKKKIAHLLTDERRFHAPVQVLERVYKFFNGPPQLDPATFEGSIIDAKISVPFPDIMDTDGWCIPAPGAIGAGNNGHSTTQFVPIQSCFMHVPILPSKRRYETDTEVIFLDDIRLAGQLNSKLWEEFSNGNISEAISIVPTSATWFGKTELADWPCVVMSGLKFEQANGTDPSGKKYFEVHSYIAVYLGRDPIRQAQFVQTFQDLGISLGQNSASATIGMDPSQINLNSKNNNNNAMTNGNSNSGGQNHRWIAGFRRLFRSQLTSSSKGQGEQARATDSGWTPKDDEDESIDPQFDDIYSILPPTKKPRLDRVGRPSDTRAAWHHNKRRKMEGEEYYKLKDPDLTRKRLESDDDDDMSE